MMKDVDKNYDFTEMISKSQDEIWEEIKDEVLQNRINEMKKRTESRNRNARKRKVAGVKKVAASALAVAILYISSIGVKAIQGARECSHVGYDILKSHSCYVKNDVSSGKTYISVGDYNNYELATPEDYVNLQNILTEEGFTDSQSLLALSSICSDYKGSYTFSKDEMPTQGEVMQAAIKGMEDYELFNNIGRSK